ncbi:phBC6A51 family helix-turn-helix protein [Weissella ceti]|uniref:Homeodomain phBC6A51-type domain-containing protein n=1 Tax=Weissella ceti TaxID=759620 RepID=A0A088GGH2_9LACO|nr:phBC6A51 family helix-turn-helix protein [Weissella ceti]AIM63076.1 hypothetical protein WS74_0824 [Weissella ceti]
MTLTKKQLRLVELVFEGNMTLAQMAEELNVSSKTITNWKNKPEFQEAMVETGNATINTNIGKLMRNVERIALDGKSDYVQLEASKYLLDKSGVGENQELDINFKPVEIIDDIKRQADK